MLLKKFKPGPRALAVLVLLFLISPPFLARTDLSFLVRVFGIMGIYMLLALGVNMVLGYVGLLDLGFMAFYAIGAYTTALLSLRGWSFWACLPVSLLVTMTVRTIIGAPALRLSGDYLAIVTLGFGEIARIVLNNWDSLTQGPKGVSLLSSLNVKPIAFFGLPIDSNVDFFYLIYVFVALALLVCHRLVHSRIGRAWLAIRENELAASAMGINVTKLKNLAFAVSAGFAAVAGSVFARWENFVTPESFTFWESALLVCTVVLGGMGSLPGVILGTVIVVGTPELLRAHFMTAILGSNAVNARYLIFGVILIAMAIFRPQGLWPRREKTAPAPPGGA